MSNERLVPIISNCQWLVNCNNVNNNNKCIYIQEASGCHRCFVSNVSLVLKRTKSGEEFLFFLSEIARFSPLIIAFFLTQSSLICDNVIKNHTDNDLYTSINIYCRIYNIKTSRCILYTGNVINTFIMTSLVEPSTRRRELQSRHINIFRFILIHNRQKYRN